MSRDFDMYTEWVSAVSGFLDGVEGKLDGE
jgi:hypothetical protein